MSPGERRPGIGDDIEMLVRLTQQPKFVAVYNGRL